MLTGARGVGKTQLAAAYARARLAGGWRLIAWVNARDSESLLAGLAAVAEAAKLSDDGSRHGPVDPGQAVRRWLEADGSRCLLVFDDAEDPGLLEPFVPAAGAARILISMARDAVEELGETVQVDVFSAAEAQALLAGRTGLADEAGASAVAVELGYLPLALDQAAAVIAGQHLGYAAYLAKLKALPVGDYLVRGEDGEKQPYPPGVAEAVLLSLEAAWAADPIGVCAGVMETMAMLSPAVVRRDLLHAAGQAGTLLGRGRRVAAAMVDQALERLNERSLLCFGLDGQAVTVHCLVARVVRGGLARRGRLAAACGAAAAAVEASAEALGKPADHAAVREMLGQVTALLGNAGAAAEDADEKLTSMLMRLRLLALDHLAGLGDSAQLVITIGEPLLADLGRALGPGDLDTQNARITLAAAFHAAGRVAEAIPLLQESLAAQVQVLGADFPGALALRNNLASAYLATGQAAEAIPLFEENATSCERLLGTDHPKTVASRHKLALARHEAEQAAGRVSEAIPLFEQTLDGRELVLGAGHLDVEAARDNLAAAQQKTDWVDETLPLAPPAADAPSDPVPGPPAAPAAEEPHAATVYEGPPVAAPAAGTDNDPAPEPASTPEPEPEPETPKDVSEPETAAVAEAPPAEELPAAPPAEEPPAVPVTEPHAVLVAGPPDPVLVLPAAPADEEPPPAAPAAETIDDPAPEPASTPEPEPEPETPKDVSGPKPPTAAVAEAPPAEEPPAAPPAEEPPAVPVTERGS